MSSIKVSDSTEFSFDTINFDTIKLGNTYNNTFNTLFENLSYKNIDKFLYDSKIGSTLRNTFI